MGAHSLTSLLKKLKVREEAGAQNFFQVRYFDISVKGNLLKKMKTSCFGFVACAIGLADEKKITSNHVPDHEKTGLR